MQISVSVSLGDNDNFAYTPDAGAAQVLAALGGNPTEDHCVLTVAQMAADTAGTPPPPPDTPA